MVAKCAEGIRPKIEAHDQNGQQKDGTEKAASHFLDDTGRLDDMEFPPFKIAYK